MTLDTIDMKYLAVHGQVIRSSQERILLRLSGLLDDNDEEWVPTPPEMPEWAFDGNVFYAELLEEIETFQGLRDRPDTLRNFTQPKYLSLPIEEQMVKLRDFVRRVEERTI